VAASTSMEGVPVTVDEVRRILAGDRPPGVSDETSAQVQGYRSAMEYVLNRADDPNFQWHTELVLAVHDRVLASSYAVEAGRLRVIQNRVADSSTGLLRYMPPEPDAVPGSMAELVDWLSEMDEIAVPVRAAVAHVYLAGVHPFRDGNGRTARVFSSLVMYRGGYQRQEFTSLEEWWGRHRSDYYDAFVCLGDSWRPDADVTEFVETHVHAQVTQVEALSLRRTVDRAVWTVLEDLAHDIEMDARVAFALHEGFFGREVTNRYYRGLTDVSTVTASNDMSALVASGLLVRQGAGRSTAYTGSPALVERIATLTGVDPAVADAVWTIREQGAAVVAVLAERFRDAHPAAG